MHRFPTAMVIGLLLTAVLFMTGWCFYQDIKTATERAAKGSILIATRVALTSVRWRTDVRASCKHITCRAPLT
jgi:hypothetical protein